MRCRAFGLSAHRDSGSTLFANFLLLATSLIVLGFTTEILLRAFPRALLPKGEYGTTRYDPNTGLKVHATPVIYNKTRFVRHTPNADGFLDVEHRPEKPPGTLRVAFFGDSYVQAEQVPLSEAFFRQIPSVVSGRDVETIAIGVSGLGTLHSLMNYQAYGRKYDADAVVYLFVKNDPGDHLYYFRKNKPIPSAIPNDSPLGYDVIRPDDWRKQYENPSIALRAATFMKVNTLLGEVLYTQIQLARISLRKWATRSTAPTEGGWVGVVDRNDIPSSWPPQLLDEARLLTRNVLARFKQEVEDDGRDFYVLYVPRIQGELEGLLGPEDIWLPWLQTVCNELGIELLDPTAALNARRLAGDPVYDDHWSPAGHEVIASFLTAFLETYIADKAARRSTIRPG